MFDLLIPATEVSKITTKSYINVNSFLAYLMLDASGKVEG
jgi:hypothetical protein